MDERELDRAIDTAAGAMMAREPGRTLTHTVMLRLREDAESFRPRLSWAAAAASVFLCAAIAIALIYRTSGAVPALPSAPAAPPLVVAQPPAMIEPPIVANDMRHAPGRRTGSAPPVRSASLAEVMRPDASPIAPLEAEPIVVAVIDVPRIEPLPPASIEPINIEQLTIEPLAVSND